MLFNPSLNDVRQFFIAAWKKSIALQPSADPISPLEMKAIAIVQKHPEYWEWITADDALTRSPPAGMMSPFLHLSLHLALEEQLAIDHPPGIVACKVALCRTREAHQAEHIMMECLANMVQEAQQAGRWPDTQEYLDRLKRIISNPPLIH
jgi:Domain of unknown function (DUF1841)